MSSDGDGPVVLPAQFGLQERWRQLRDCRRPHRSGNHLGVTIEGDIIKQKAGGQPIAGSKVIGFGKTAPGMYDKLGRTTQSISAGTQVINCYMGRAGPNQLRRRSHGASDLKEAVRTAVINKRAGGMGLISGRKSFQRPMKEGVEYLHAIQDVYLNPTVTIA